MLRFVSSTLHSGRKSLRLSELTCDRAVCERFLVTGGTIWTYRASKKIMLFENLIGRFEYCLEISHCSRRDTLICIQFTACLMLLHFKTELDTLMPPLSWPVRSTYTMLFARWHDQLVSA
jgi:hypothetical protein